MRILTIYNFFDSTTNLITSRTSTGGKRKRWFN